MHFFKNHKEYEISLNRDIFKTPYLCKVCENACLIVKGISKSLKTKLQINPHDLVEKFSRSGKSDCMNRKYDSCSTPPQWENDDSTSS